MFFRAGRFSLLLLGAAAFASRSAPAESQWFEIRSPHFSVITDAGEKRGREVAVRFEQMRAVFASLMNKANVNIPVPLQIVAFRNTKELRQVAPLWHGKPTEIAGLFQAGQDRSFIMLDMSVEDPWTVVFHEYAHQLMSGVVGADLDPWFEEGFAVYFSSIEVDGKEAIIGKIPAAEFQTLQQGIMKVSDLLRVQHNSVTYNESGDHRSVFYAESGMLVHYLYDSNLFPKVATYLDLKINHGRSVEDAFQLAFGMNVAQFDKVFRSYLVSGRYRGYKLSTPPDVLAKGYDVSTLGSNDANAVIADIHLHSPDYRDKAVAEFEDILKQDSNNAAAARGLGYAYLQARDFGKAAEYFKRAAAGNSKDPRVHYYSALLMNIDWSEHSDAAEMTRELETAISLDPGFADAYMLLGYASARAGDVPKALMNMKKAVSLSPRNEQYRFNLAQMYLTNRQADEGIEILQVLSRSSDAAVAHRAQESLARAEQFKAAMHSGAVGPGLQSRGAPTEVNDSALVQSVASQSGASAPETAVTLPPATVKFLKGTIRSVDCSSSPAAILIVDSGSEAWTMRVADTKHALILGADAFSCEWNKQKVAINYRETGESTGSVVSIEVQ